MEYQNELKRLEEGGTFWKPKPGQFKITSLTEIEEAEPFTKEVETVQGISTETSEQRKITMKIEGEEGTKTWTFGKGKTPASTYGQLVAIAAKTGTLKDVEFTVIVKSDGTKNDYTII